MPTSLRILAVGSPPYREIVQLTDQYGLPRPRQRHHPEFITDSTIPFLNRGWARHQPVGPPPFVLMERRAQMGATTALTITDDQALEDWRVHSQELGRQSDAARRGDWPVSAWLLQAEEMLIKAPPAPLGLADYSARRPVRMKDGTVKRLPGQRAGRQGNRRNRRGRPPPHRQKGDDARRACQSIPGSSKGTRAKGRPVACRAALA